MLILNSCFILQRSEPVIVNAGNHTIDVSMNCFGARMVTQGNFNLEAGKVYTILVGRDSKELMYKRVTVLILSRISNYFWVE